MCNHFQPVILIWVFAAALQGCGTPSHTNTLIFGTNTKFALDLSVNPAGGTPDFTLGYKRQEAVWMPLLANKEIDQANEPGDQSKPSDCSNSNTNHCLFQSENNEGKQIDTYSVLASFGAEFGGRATGSGGSDTEASGSGGLAQFFATGIAAQTLASSGGARLVSIQSADAEKTSLALESAELAKRRVSEIDQEFQNLLGKETYEAYRSKGSNATKVLEAKNGVIIQSIMDSKANLDEQKWAELVDSSALDNETKLELNKYRDLSTVKSYLTGQAGSQKEEIINALHAEL